MSRRDIVAASAPRAALRVHRNVGMVD